MERETEKSSIGNQAFSLKPVKDEHRLNITLATDAPGWKITVTEQLVTELAKNPLVKVSGLIPSCTEELRDWAKKSSIELVEPKKMCGYIDKELLAYPPDSLEIDILMIHSYGHALGKQAQVIKDIKKCKWVHVVHTNSEELEKYMKEEASLQTARRKISEHQLQLQLCDLADIVIAIGPKVAEAYRSYLRSSGKDVVDLTPEIVNDLIDVRPVHDEEDVVFRVMISATYHAKYFLAKGCDIAARAIASLKDSSYRAIFIVEPTDDAEELRTKLKEHIKPRQFTVRSFSRGTENWKKLLCEVDLCIMPSRTEGFGTTNLIAMSADVPVIVSGNSGLGMVLEQLPSGAQHVVDSEEPQDWANKIKETREKGAKDCASEAKQLRMEYMKKISWRKQCDHLVEKMIGMCPKKQDGKKECVEHVEERDLVDRVEGFYSETRMQQWELKSAPDQEKDNDTMKKGFQEMILTETRFDSLEWEKMGADLKPMGTEEDGGISKMSVEETSQKNPGIDTVDAGSHQLSKPRLSTNIMDIPYSVLGRVCLKLNIRDDLQYKDFRMLGEKLDYEKDITRYLEQQKNPTNTLLKMWSSSNRQATVGRLIELLKEKDMERLDVAEILEGWVQSEV